MKSVINTIITVTVLFASACSTVTAQEPKTPHPDLLSRIENGLKHAAQPPLKFGPPKRLTVAELQLKLLTRDTRTLRAMTEAVLRNIDSTIHEALHARERATKERLDDYVARAQQWGTKTREKRDAEGTRFLRAFAAAKRDDRKQDMARLAAEWKTRRDFLERRLRTNEANIANANVEIKRLRTILSASTTPGSRGFEQGPPKPPELPSASGSPQPGSRLLKEPEAPALDPEEAMKVFEEELNLNKGNDNNKGKTNEFEEVLESMGAGTGAMKKALKTVKPAMSKEV